MRETDLRHMAAKGERSVEVSADQSVRRSRGPKPLGSLTPLVILIYFFHTVWFQIISFGTVFSFVTASEVAVEQTAFQIAVLLGCAALIVFDRWAKRFNHVLSWSVTLALLMGASLLMLSVNQILIDPLIAAVLGGLLVGFGYAWIFLSMFRLFKNNGTMWEFVIVLVVSNAAASIAIGAMLTYLPDDVLYAMVLFCMLLNGVLLKRAQKAVHIDKDPQRYSSKASWEITKSALKNVTSLRNEAILLIVLTLTVNIMRILNKNLPWEQSRIVATWFSDPFAIFAEIAIYVGVGLLLFYAVTHFVGDVWSQAPFFVMLTGLIGLFFVRAEVQDLQVFAVYSMAMEWLFQLTYTFTLVTILRALPLTTFQIVGLAIIFSNVLALLRTFLFEELLVNIGLALIGVAYLIAIYISSLRRDDLAAAMKAEPNDDNKSQSSEQALSVRIQEVAQKGNLTLREAQILDLLVHGMSLPQVQQELVVSNNTVRTHVKHIYQKLDVHTRQELISLFLR